MKLELNSGPPQRRDCYLMGIFNFIWISRTVTSIYSSLESSKTWFSGDFLQLVCFPELKWFMILRRHVRSGWYDLDRASCRDLEIVTLNGFQRTLSLHSVEDISPCWGPLPIIFHKLMFHAPNIYRKFIPCETIQFEQVSENLLFSLPHHI